MAVPTWGLGLGRGGGADIEREQQPAFAASNQPRATPWGVPLQVSDEMRAFWQWELEKGISRALELSSYQLTNTVNRWAARPYGECVL